MCPKTGINPTVLLWRWDWDHQSYSREGSGCNRYTLEVQDQTKNGLLDDPCKGFPTTNGQSLVFGLPRYIYIYSYLPTSIFYLERLATTNKLHLADLMSLQHLEKAVALKVAWN